MSTASAAAVPPEVAASQLVFQLATGYIASSALYVAVKLRIADRLADGPRPVADLAAAVAVDEDALYRVLRSQRDKELSEVRCAASSSISIT